MASTSKGKDDQESVEARRDLLSGPTVGTPHAEANPEAARSFMQRRAAQREAYGQFVAEEDIYDPDGNALVFTAGMQVPVEHVEKWELEDVGKVRRVATPEEARKRFLPPSIGPASLIGDAAATTTPATAAGTENKK